MRRGAEERQIRASEREREREKEVEKKGICSPFGVK